MDDTLRMDINRYFLRWQIKKPTCFNYFQSFIHHRGRINGNFLTHAPVWVVQGIFYRNVRQLVSRQIKKRSTRGGQYYTFYIVFSMALQGLKNSAVLAVDRVKLDVIALTISMMM